MKKLLFLLLLFCCVSSAQEGLLNKLLAPGPLVLGHADLEKNDCLKCHDAGKGVTDEKCLACHKALKPFIEKKSGFHGIHAQSCKECHIEHKGRDHDTIAIEQKDFEHEKKTGYKLEGKHAEIKCADCHKDLMAKTSVRAGQIRYFGKHASCVSCHKKDDVHFYKGDWAKKDCQVCHSSVSWKEQNQFNHKKDTGYDLVGRHAKLSCAECHTPKDENKKIIKVVYKWPNLKSAACLTCHKDQHGNNVSAKFRGGQCLKCHDQQHWKLEAFDHKVTGYPLRGKHFEIKCQECHIQKNKVQLPKDPEFRFAGLKSACLTCHKDYHYFKGQQNKTFKNLNQCQGCHNEKTWKEVSRFAHNIHTRYRLDGKHLKLDCLDCHVRFDKEKKFLGSTYKWPQLESKTCEACHKSPHTNQFSRDLLKKVCTECHVTSGWHDSKTGKFDHSETRFPLDGAHEKTKCEACHGEAKKQTFKFKSADQKFCIDCHQNIHNKQFSEKTVIAQCTDCHTTKNFTERRPFDHTQTRYPLEGAHNDVKCENCHKPSLEKTELRYPNIAKDKGVKTLTKSQYLFPHVQVDRCLDCHTDYHQKQLGESCLDCHKTSGWKDNKFDHNRQSDFKLKYKHEDVKCSECHKPIANAFVKVKDEQRKVSRYKPLPQTCVSCHKDVHKGQFGSKCQECHTEKGWRLTRDFHKNFTLTGVHFSLECAECHRDNRKLAGSSQQCLNCHAKDDVHRGTLPQCQECHRQQFWEVVGFKHSLTQFPLRGAHRTLDCMECHQSGTYKGLNSACSACHMADAVSVVTPNHSAFPNINQCQDCHQNHFAW